MDIDTMSMAVSLLVAEGFQAIVEYPGTIQLINEKRQLFVFSAANADFRAEISTGISSDTEDPVLVAETIAKIVSPNSHNKFVCAYCCNVLTPGGKVVFHQNSDTSIDVFCSDACKYEIPEEEKEI